MDAYFLIEQLAYEDSDSIHVSEVFIE